jgi:translation initiation factor 3 subunit A
MSFCPDLNSIKRKNSNNEYGTEETIEKENIILNIIDFNYNNYEINNDLLFNISMGFIDMTKLKLENVDKPKNNDNLKQDKSTSNKDIEVELKTDLMNKLEKFVKAHEKIEFFSSCIHEFHKDLNELQNLNQNSEKNKILLKWEKILTENNKLYQKDLAEQKEKEREKKRKEEKLQKETEEQRLIKIQKEKKFEAELEKIRKKASKKVEKDRRSLLYLGPKRISKDLNFSKDLFSTPTIKSLYSAKSVSPCSLRHKNINRKASSKNNNNAKNTNRKKRGSIFSDNSKVYLGYQKICKSFNFKIK